ncbi:MAG: restriction endonuclease [Balneolaceae bacterium]|nr:restriction endonuclease [Balneolaceae bacterium]
MTQPILVTKASGEQEPFEEKKLRRSLRSAGANDETINSIAEAVNQLLHDGISTQKIYREAFRLLQEESERLAGRYKLKDAILELGPTGYPFEQFIAKLLNRQGYKTEVGEIVEGDCVSHEIDVIAQKDDEHFMIECKFHNRKGHTCDVKVPLYIQSRFLDLKTKWTSLPGHKNKVHKGWVATNTRFTKDAQQYAECIGLKLLSWDYPKNEGLKDLISRAKLHPVTCLSSLDKAEKQELLEMDIILCSQLLEHEQILDKIGIDQRKKTQILNEAGSICNRDQEEK